MSSHWSIGRYFPTQAFEPSGGPASNGPLTSMRVPCSTPALCFKNLPVAKENNRRHRRSSYRPFRKMSGTEISTSNIPYVRLGKSGLKVSRLILCVTPWSCCLRVGETLTVALLEDA